MSDREFEIAGKKFKLNKIDALKQFHIVRRITPILSELLPALTSLAKGNKSPESLSQAKQMEYFSKIAAPIMNGLSKLTDEDADRVLFGLLSSVEIQQSAGNWARLATDSSLMFQDLELPVLIQGAGRAFAYNMAGFFAALPQGS